MSTLSTTLEENPIWSLSAACSFPDCPIVRRKDLELEQAKQEKQQLTEENERLRELINKRNSAVFGRSSEKQPEPQTVQQTDIPEGAGDCAPAQGRKRGARIGHQGHGRKIPDLPEITVIHELPDDETYCPNCGKRRLLTGFAEVSYEIDYEIRFVRKKHIRKKAFNTCNCPGPRSVTAPKQPQVIPKGMFSKAFPAHILVMKFFFQIPLRRGWP